MRKTTSDFMVNFSSILKTKLDNILRTAESYRRTIDTHDDTHPSVQDCKDIIMEIHNRLKAVDEMGESLTGFVLKNTNSYDSNNYSDTVKSDPISFKGKLSKDEHNRSSKGSYNNIYRLADVIKKDNRNVADDIMDEATAKSSNETYKQSISKDKKTKASEGPISTDQNLNNCLSARESFIKQYEKSSSKSELGGYVKESPLKDRQFSSTVVSKSLILKKLNAMKGRKSKYRLIMKANALFYALEHGFDVSSRKYEIPLATLKNWYKMITQQKLDLKKHSKLEIRLIKWLNDRYESKFGDLTANIIIKTAREMKKPGDKQAIDYKWYESFLAKHPWIMDYLKPEVIIKSEDMPE